MKRKQQQHHQKKRQKRKGKWVKNKKNIKKNNGKRTKKVQVYDERISIKKRLAKVVPPKGTNPLGQTDTPKLFSELPLSKNTKKGLKESGYTTMTDIQTASILHALEGRDVLGSAETGSGKTLAFLVPVFEKLFMEKWTREDGLGALIIAPLRELAMQIFEVVTAVGRFHDFSAGVILGGMNFREEAQTLTAANIIVATPGRLLQHLDQSAGFEFGSLRILVLDETDRILDLGFRETVDAILEAIPVDRQTLLFSATQTKSVKDIGRVTTRDAEHIFVHEDRDTRTPEGLNQNIIIVPLDQKIMMLWSFIKTHKFHKIVAFVQTCKQVRYLYESLRRMDPGMSLMELHGRMGQAKRMATYERLVEQKQGCIIATNVAARGLDIPNVDWVIQVDCPEDVDVYTHRVGRTARYNKKGNALLFLEPSEIKMLSLLEEAKVPVNVIKVNNNQLRPCKWKLQAVVAKDPELQYTAKKAFITYVRSIYLQKNKEVFDVHKLPLDAFAESMGLASAPSIKFVKKQKFTKDAPYMPTIMSNSSAGGNSDRGASATAPQRYLNKGKAEKRKLMASVVEQLSNDSEDEDDLFVVKYNVNPLDDNNNNNNYDDDSDDDDDDESSNERSNKKKREKMKENKESSEEEDDDEEEDQTVSYNDEESTQELHQKRLKYEETMRQELKKAKPRDKKRAKKMRKKKKHKKKNKEIIKVLKVQRKNARRQGFDTEDIQAQIDALYEKLENSSSESSSEESEEGYEEEREEFESSTTTTPDMSKYSSLEAMALAQAEKRRKARESNQYY